MSGPQVCPARGREGGTRDLSAVLIAVRIAYTRRLSYETLERELVESNEGFQVVSVGEVEN